jgi:hypothetical protein
MAVHGVHLVLYNCITMANIELPIIITVYVLRHSFEFPVGDEHPEDYPIVAGTRHPEA